MEELINKWFSKNAYEPTFYLVENIECITVDVNTLELFELAATDK